MPLAFRSTITNAEYWRSVCIFYDKETDEPVDFTGASLVLQISGNDGCPRITATTENGMIGFVGAGALEIDIDMRRLRPGVYKVGCTCAINGDYVSIFTGTLTVIDGVTLHGALQ